MGLRQAQEIFFSIWHIPSVEAAALSEFPGSDRYVPAPLRRSRAQQARRIEGDGRPIALTAVDCGPKPRRSGRTIIISLVGNVDQASLWSAASIQRALDIDGNGVARGKCFLKTLIEKLVKVRNSCCGRFLHLAFKARRVWGALRLRDHLVYL
jgi:hypothetical protein